ncbi:MAG: hypothetical protein J6T74_07015 [Clostridia bacterium]|nr:hypothetical protein [Clostridia bacterium]
MKSFDETVRSIQEYIGTIEDTELRDTLKEKFSKISKNAELYSVRSYSNTISKEKIPATATVDEIFDYYTICKGRREMEYYASKDDYVIDNSNEVIDKNAFYHIPDTADKVNPRDYANIEDESNDKMAYTPPKGKWMLRFKDASNEKRRAVQYEIVNRDGEVASSNVVTDGDVSFDTFYKGVESKEIEKKNPDPLNCSSAYKTNEYLLNSHESGYGKCDSFEINTITVDETAGHTYDEKHPTKRTETEGVVKEQESYRFNGLKGKGLVARREEIAESVEKLGNDSNKKKYFSREDKTTTIVEGKITEIERERSITQDHVTKTQKETITSNPDNSFTKEIDKSKKETVEHTVEKGMLKPEEKLSINSTGTVIESTAGVQAQGGVQVQEA